MLVDIVYDESNKRCIQFSFWAGGVTSEPSTGKLRLGNLMSSCRSAALPGELQYCYHLKEIYDLERAQQNELTQMIPFSIFSSLHVLHLGSVSEEQVPLMYGLICLEYMIECSLGAAVAQLVEWAPIDSKVGGSQPVLSWPQGEVSLDKTLDTQRRMFYQSSVMPILAGKSG